MLYREGADPEVEAFVATDFTEWQPRFSRDGRWISFASDMSGQPEIYVRSSSGTGQQVQVSTGGGALAIWNPVADELLYRNLGGKVMSVSFTAEGDTFRPAPDVTTDAAVATLREHVEAAEKPGAMQSVSPLLGPLSHGEWVQFNCRHAEMHFSFMRPVDDAVG